MWIIPKQLHILVCAQDTPGLISDYQEQLKILEQLHIQISKATQSRILSQKLSPDFWMLRLFGRILKPSHIPNFTRKLISYQPDSLVNHFRTQAKEKEQMTKDIFFPIFEKVSNYVDLPLYSSKTLSELSVQSSQMTIQQLIKIRPFCYMSVEKWKESIMNVRSEYLARENAARRIFEKEFSYYVEIKEFQIITSKNIKNISMNQLNQKQSIRVLKTKNKNFSNRRAWCTPTKSTYKMMYLSPTATKKRIKDKRQMCIGLENAEFLIDCLKKWHLNPRWLEMIMGVPIGWTQVTSTKIIQIEKKKLNC